MAATETAVVLGSNRIPFARSNGPYASASNQDMLTAALDGLVDRTGIAGERLGEVAGGAVLKHSRDFNLTRESLLGTRIAPETPAYDVGQACGTGLETAILVANKIALGQIESGIAGGVDTTSDAPIAVNDDLREILLERNSARSNVDRSGLSRAPARPARPRDPAQRRAADRPVDGRAHGDHGPRVGHHPARPGRARGGQPSAPRRRLRRRASRTTSSRPTSGSSATRTSAPTRRVESLAKLKPVFGGEDGTMTAGNSTPLSDGASAVLLGTRDGPSSTASSRWPASSTPRRPRSTTSAPARAC